MNTTNPMMRAITTERATMSIIVELVNLNAKMRSGKLKIQNKSVTFLYLILFNALRKKLGTNLFTKINIKNIKVSEANMMKRMP